MSMLDELRRIREEAGAVRARVDEARAAQRQAVASREQAEAAYESYMEAVGAGEIEPSADEEERLTAGLALARAAASPRAWKGRIRGAERAAGEADRTVEAWLFDQAHALGDELAELAGPLAERAVAHYRAQLALEDEIAELIRRWYDLAEPFGLAPPELPTSPFRGSSDDVHGKLGGEVDAERLLLPARWPVDGAHATLGDEASELAGDGGRRVLPDNGEIDFRAIPGAEQDAAQAAADLQPGRWEG